MTQAQFSTVLIALIRTSQQDGRRSTPQTQAAIARFEDMLVNGFADLSLRTLGESHKGTPASAPEAET